MVDILAALKGVVDALGATVLLPIIIFVIALVLGAKPGRAFRAGLTIGIAFIGINLVLGLMLTTLGGVAQAIVTNTGMQRDIVDVGWPSAAAIAFGSSVGLWVIPIGILVNVALLFTGLTRTLNVDVWNFWHFAFVGSLVVAATGSLGYGLLAAALMAALSLVLADWTAKGVQRFYGVPGVSVPHLASAQIVPLAIALNWIMDRIPGVNRIRVDTETVQRRLGVFGEPIVMGLMIGLVLGLVAYAGSADLGTVITKSLQTGMSLAAVMLLLPRMVKILMEGLIPVSEAARDFVQKRAGDREIHVGLDSAILIGHPAAIASSLILVPVAILLSLILPGNRIILFADLAVIPFVVAMAAPIVNGNVFRMVVIGTVTLVVGFYVGMALSPLMTTTAADSGFAIPANATGITSVVDGFLYIPWIVIRLTEMLGLVGLLLVLAGVVALLLVWRAAPGAMKRLAGAEEPTPVPATVPARPMEKRA
ncbi:MULTISPECIES: PTS galactitol transporter subunit IIC [unclassified Aureimonas]|uniref:PTS galactitol transporter subunit IIC n=1 Tax=unclassified Aureimonas TaxID=2615206 RepID=UPI0006F6690E|nr:MULTISPECIES: PTS transporter subunit IIC [unclassified Aureimonas]KQT52127.1 DNA mismatch repair protein MutT [Aureimonas sp. Leaf427]KQT70639.1 DNA mismatch repair protein MutT [Aureimonas sp. Leaf460]